ncbi:MAG: hypothetical protein K2F78_07045, partial [Muribaculaceae bacterium]|nr:hypothetical protein [Muribaculaceae bacterium]
LNQTTSYSSIRSLVRSERCIRDSHDRVVEVFNKYKGSGEGTAYIDAITRIPLKGTSATFAFIVSLMKLGRQEDADEHITSVRPFLEALMNEALMPVRMNIRSIFTLIDKIRRHPASDRLYWEYFDMLNYSKF